MTTQERPAAPTKSWRQRWGRRFIVVGILALVFGVLWWTRLPQQATLTWALRAGSGFSANIENFDSVYPLHIGQIRLFDVDDGTVAASPTLELSGLSTTYSLNPNAGRMIDDVHVETVTARIHLLDGPASSINVLESNASGGSTSMPTVRTRYIPESLSVDNIALEFVGEGGSLNLGNLALTMRYPRRPDLELQIKTEGLTGDWRLGDSETLHSLAGGVVDIAADRRFDGGEISPIRISLPELVDIEGKASAVFEGPRVRYRGEITTARIDGAVAKLFEGREGWPIIRFGAIDIRDTVLHGTQRLAGSSVPYVRVDASVTAAHIGPDDAPYYTGDASIKGEFDDRKGTFDVTLGQGQVVQFAMEGLGAIPKGTVSVTDWSRENLADALPASLRNSVTTLTQLHQLDASIAFGAITAGIELGIDVKPTLAFTEKARQFRLTLDGVVDRSGDLGPLFNSKGTLNIVDGPKIADVVFEVPQDFSSGDVTLTLGEDSATAIAGVFGAAATTETAEGALAGTVDVMVHRGDSKDPLASWNITSELDALAGLFGVGGVRGSAISNGSIRTTASGVSANVGATITNAVLFDTLSLMSSPLEVDGVVQYQSASRTVLSPSLKIAYGDATTVSLDGLAYDVTTKAYTSPFSITSDLAPLVSMGTLKSVAGTGRVYGTLSGGPEGMRADSNITADLASIILSAGSIAVLNGALRAQVQYTDGLHGDGLFTADSLAAAGVQLKKLSAPLRFDGDAIHIDDMPAELFGGTIKVDLSAVVLGDAPHVSMTIELTGVNLDTFTKEFKLPGASLTGIANGTISLEANGTGFTALSLRLRSTEGFSISRDLVKDLLMSEYVTGIPMSAKVRGAIDKTIGDAEQRPFASAELNLDLEGERLVGGAPMLSENLNLDLVLSIDLKEVYAALALQQEAQLENVANIGLAPVQ